MNFNVFTNITLLTFTAMLHIILTKNGSIVSAFIISSAAVIDIVLFNIYSNFFPKLNFFTLKKHVRRIPKDFPGAKIKQISIRKYDSPYERGLGGDVPTKYYLLITVSSPLSENAKRLESNTLNFHSTPDKPKLREIGLRNDFIEVYRADPGEEYISEWQFLVYDNSKLNNLSGTFGGEWVLYKKIFI